MHPTQQKLLLLAQKTDIGNLTLRELGELIDGELPQTVKHHVLQLLKKGLIMRDPRTGSISPVREGIGQHPNLYSIPIYGSANCGSPTLMAEESLVGYLKVSERLLPSKKRSLYALKAVGTSLNKANIYGSNIEDGDYVIIDSELRTPKDGDYVIITIDGSASMKKFRRSAANVSFISESTRDHAPIILHVEDQYDSLICGTIVRVIKKNKD